MDSQPRHRVAFDPGEVWLGESRLISHQINYGDAAMVYMWFVRPGSMAEPANRFNARLERIHREMSDRAAAATGAPIACQVLEGHEAFVTHVSLESGTLACEEHRIAVAEKTISICDRVLVSAHDICESAERTDQHEQR